MSTTTQLSLDEYDQMIADGAFGRRGRQRLEFIHGEIREMSPIGSQHETIVSRLMVWSLDHTPRKRIEVRVQCSISLQGKVAPEPDIAWVVRGDYFGSRPTEKQVLLIIEVADTSLTYDRGEKACLYAAAGIADYWIVNLINRSIEVHRLPVDGTYQSVQVFAGQEEVTPHALPEARLRPSQLWSNTSET